MTDPSQTASIDIEYYFNGTHDTGYDANVTPQILATVNQSDVVLGTTPTGYMLDTPATSPVMPASAQSLNGTTVSVYYVTDPTQTATIDIEYYFDGTHNSSYDANITPQILGTVNQADVVLGTTPTGYMLDSTPTAPTLPASAQSLNNTTVSVYYVTDSSQTASIDIEYYFDGTHNSSYDATITPQILSSVSVSDVVLGSAPTGFALDSTPTSPVLPESAQTLNGTTVAVYYVTDTGQTANIDIEYYFDGTHNSSYDANITPQILGTVNQADVVLGTTPTGYMLDTPATAPVLPASAQSLDGMTVAVYYVTDPSQTASIDIEYYFNGTHDTGYDATITPQILSSVSVSDVVLGSTPTGYTLDSTPTSPVLPESALTLNGTTISVYYVTDASQQASIDIEYYFDGTHNSSYDANITPQILGTVNQADVVLGTTPTGYMLDTPATAPVLPQSAQSLNGTTVSVYYVTDVSQTASIDIEYYFDGTHNSSYDANITPQILGTVNQADVVLSTTPTGYALDMPATAPVLPASAQSLNGATVSVYYVTDASQTATINIEYYFDGTHNSSYDATITPQILSSVNQSDVVLGTTPTGYMLDSTPTSPVLPASAAILNATTVSVYYVTDASQTATINIEYYFDGTHDVSYDATITPQILSNVNQSDVVLSTVPTGYTLDTPATLPALPETATNLNNTTVVVYYKSLPRVIEHHVDRAGNTVAADTSAIVTGGIYVGMHIQTVSDHIYVGPEYSAPTSAMPSAVTGASVPMIPSVTTDTDVWYVYGQDKGGSPTPGPDGIEDITITRHWSFISGGAYVAVGTTTPEIEYVNIGDTFTKNELAAPAPSIPAGYTYNGYLTDTDAITTTPYAGSPSITASLDQDRDVYYVYDANPYWVAFHVVDTSDTAIASITAPAAYTGLITGATWGPVSAPSGGIYYNYVGWKEGIGGSVNTTPITGMIAAANLDIYLIYSAITYSVTYDINGGNTGTGPAPDTSLMPNTTHTLATTPVPTHASKAGSPVVFIGWTASKDTRIYAKNDVPPTTISNIYMDNNKTVHAVWGLDINNNGIPDVNETWYNVTENYVDREGKVVRAAKTTSYASTDNFAPVSAPGITNYVYVGW